MAKKAKRKLISMKGLKKKAESEFHRWILTRDKFICFTCSEFGNQAGHFRHRRLDFDERNLHCQCFRCNAKFVLAGNLGVYAVRLDKEYGQGTAERLILRSNTESNKFSRQDLCEFYEHYKRLNEAGL